MSRAGELMPSSHRKTKPPTYEVGGFVVVVLRDLCYWNLDHAPTARGALAHDLTTFADRPYVVRHLAVVNDGDLEDMLLTVLERKHVANDGIALRDALSRVHAKCCDSRITFTHERHAARPGREQAVLTT